MKDEQISQDQNKISEMLSSLQKDGSASSKLPVILTSSAEGQEESMSEGYNAGVWCLETLNVPVPSYKNMYEQFEDIKQRMLFLAQANKDYKGEEFSPDTSKSEVVDSLPSLSAQLIDMLKSDYSPPLKSLISLKLSHRPILGPYKSKKSGVIFIGQFKDGMPDGLIFFVDKAGGFFYGEFKGGKPNGIGFRGYSSGLIYFGQWKEGRFNGNGISYYPNGNTYDGEFKAGKRNGQGTYTWKEGKKFVGEFKDDNINGLGLMSYTNGDSYSGEWIKEKFEGKGVFT